VTNPHVEIYLELPPLAELPPNVIERLERLIEGELKEWIAFKTGVTVLRAGWLKDREPIVRGERE
jgi:hypothetical protein